MADLPLILAGPIVRRVQPDLVSVWVALSQPRKIRLSVWEGVKSAGSADGLVTEDPPLFTGERDTLRVGDKLHVAVVMAEPQVALRSQQIYAYNLGFGDITAGTFAAQEDLNTLHLLQSNPIDGLPHAALGYEPGLLPTFATLPDDITDLRIVHGSCRRLHQKSLDALAWLDDLIADARATQDPRGRFHQLFLTGDQIYADDVAMPLLAALNTVGATLIGTRLVPDDEDPAREVDVPREHLPFRGRNLPADLAHFPVALRSNVMVTEAFFTGSTSSHLMSLGEYCAMHLLAWSNVLWPTRAVPNQELHALDLPGPEAVFSGPSIPHAIWAVHAGDLKEGDLVEQPTDFLVGPRVREFLDEQREKQQDGYAAQVRILTQLYQTLPKVRRALANIPTYMIFDDHDVTDDWYLTRQWRDRVLTSPLGRTIVRNGMLAYTVCQGWGNTPKEFEISPRAGLLAEASRLFDAEQGPVEAAANEIDRLLGLGGGEPPISWHYDVSGINHKVIVLDTRTRRAFPGRSTPPRLISEAALQEQIPPEPQEPLPAGIEVLVVISATSVLSPLVIEALALPLVNRLYEALNFQEIRDLPGTKLDTEGWPGDTRGFEELLERLAFYRQVVVLSGEIHFSFSASLSYWHQDDDEPARIAQFTSSGLKNQIEALATAARHVGFAPKLLALPVEQLGWDSDFPEPIVPPSTLSVRPSVRNLLRRSPVVVPTSGWPAGTTLSREPDYRWRMEFIKDERPEASRHPAVQAIPLDSDLDPTKPIESYRRIAQRHAAMVDRMSHSRQVIYVSNIGVVRFEHQVVDQEEILAARHELYAVHPEALPPDKPFLSAVHVVPLRAPDETRPTLRIVS